MGTLAAAILWIGLIMAAMIIADGLKAIAEAIEKSKE